MRTERLEIPNDKGYSLAARLELPAEGVAGAYVLFAHCFTCSKDLAAVRNICRSLSQEGFGVLRFDFTGLGESEGEFKDSHFSANVDDLLDVARYMEEHLEAPSVLVGHSLGGAAVIHAAASLDSVKAVVTIGAPSDPEHVTHLFQDEVDGLAEGEERKVTIGGRPLVLDGGFAKHLLEKDAVDVLKGLRKVAFLIAHSPQDTTVSVDHAARLYHAARHPKSFLSLDGADHLLSNKKDSAYVGQMIASWSSRYVEQKSQPVLETKEQAVAVLTGPGFTTKVRSGNHHLLGDEPKSVGGADLGPSPYDFVAIGLATCTAMTIRMYVDRKGWELDEIEVHVSHDDVHAEDCAHCEESTGKVDHFFRKIKLSGSLDEAQHKRVMQIADKCPVHRTLESETHVITESI